MVKKLSEPCISSKYLASWPLFLLNHLWTVCLQTLFSNTCVFVCLSSLHGWTTVQMLRAHQWCPPPPEDWRRPPGRLKLKVVLDELELHNLTLSEAVCNTAQNRPLRRLLAASGTMQSYWYNPETTMTMMMN